MSKNKKTYFTQPLVLEGSGPFAFIGDIHGCYDELVELETIIKDNHPDVTMVSLGDLVDRGPKIHEVVEHCRHNKYILVIGNHDEKMLRWAKGNPVKLRPHHIETTKVLTEEDLEYFRNAQWFIRIPFYQTIAVHGGFWPDTPPEFQNPKQFIRMSKITPSEHKLIRMEEETPEHKHWSEYWRGPEVVVYGHSSFSKVRKTEFSVGLDTGCVYGGKLSGLVLDVDENGKKCQKIYQVDAKKEYWKKEYPW